MLKEPRSYKALAKSNAIPDPIHTDALSLNKARDECRKGMTLILQEIKLMEVDPKIVVVDDKGNSRQLPFKYPSELSERLPRYVGPPVEEMINRIDVTNLAGDELACVAKYSTNPDLSFSPLVGDSITEKSSKPFCSLDVNTKQDLDQ